MESPAALALLLVLELASPLAEEQMESPVEAQTRQESWQLVEQLAATQAGEPQVGVSLLKRLSAPGAQLPPEAASLAEEPLPASAAPLAPRQICDERSAP